MDLLADLDARGLIHATTDREALAARVDSGPVSLYYGCDPTRDSLHVGNLVGLLILRRFQLAGHRPIALAGGATGMVGDPSGRSEERNLLDADALARNVAAIKDQITAILGPPGDWLLVDNSDWTADLRLLDFLRDVGKHVTVNQMVARESVRARMASEQGISFTEFAYMLLQANDYYWLYEHEGCELQIGGSDQWGNILSGVDLIRRRRGTSVHALCWPLLTTADGTKLGKTTGATVWLAADKTSPYQLYQHFVNTDDRQVRQFLAWFTLRPVDEIDALVEAHAAAPDRREAQRVLARDVTALVHGVEASAAAEAASGVLFGRGRVSDLDADALTTIAAEVGTSSVAASRLATGIDVVDLVAETDLAGSKGEARRLVDQRGISVNDVRAEPGRVIGSGDLLHGRFLVLRRGQRQHHVVLANG
jgi:tyrosyl-tRNA synthetase